jgi:enhancing lycopene biosynthesis protein 2
MKKRIGVLLSGCGVYDGAEIHEATLTLYFLDREGAEAVCIAPDTDQFHVIHHITSGQMDEKRNVLTESARIARGNIRSLDNVSAGDLDGLIIPGGFGAAKNLVDYAVKGRECVINPRVKDLIQSLVEKKKPVGAICIAPVVLAVALREKSLKPVLTIGNDTSTADDLVYFGADHKKARVDEIVADQTNKLVTTPAYMLGPGIADIARGIEKLVQQVLQWV